MPVLALPSFAKGEISPNLYARVDTKMYKSALRTARNTIIHNYGGVSNRPGLLCIGPVKTHGVANLPILHRFHLGTSDQYVLEFGDLYMRPIRNDEYVLNTGTTITAATQADPCVVTAASHGLSNGADVRITGITAGMVELNKRRFIVRNVATDTMELEDQITGVAVDSTSYTAYTTGGTVASIYEIVTPYVQADLLFLKFVQTGNTITITYTNYAQRDLTRTDHDNWVLSIPTFAPTLAAPTNLAITTSADNNFQVFDRLNQDAAYRVTSISDVDGRFEESLPITVTTTTSSRPPLNTLTWTAESEASRYAVYRQDNGAYGLLGETELTEFEDRNLATDLTIGPPSARNPFSTLFPMASGYYQQRQAFGGTTAEPDKTWYSQTGLRLNMSVSQPLQADDAITASLSSQDVQVIRHYVPLTEDLMILTNAGEWAVNSGPDSGFSADTIKQRPQTNWGASHIQPIVVGKTILFCEEGNTRVRSLGFSISEPGIAGGYASSDMTILANHLLAEESPDEHTIVDWAFAQTPEPRVHVVRSDGQVLAFTFDQEQEVIAWSTWDTRGLFKRVTSLRRSLSDVEDGVYFAVVRRTSLGGSATFIERLHSRKFSDVRDGFFVDAGFELNEKLVITDITTADPVVITSDGHGLSDGDEVEITDIKWLQPFADICGDVGAGQPTTFNNLRFTVANKTVNTIELLDFTTTGSSGDCQINTSSFDTELNLRLPNGPFSSNANGGGVFFNPAGTKMYANETWPTARWAEWDLSVAFDIGTAVYNGVTNTNLATGQVGSSGWWSNDGGTLAIMRNAGIQVYSCSNAFSIADADLTLLGNSTWTSDIDGNASRGAFIKADGTKLWLTYRVSADDQYVAEFNLTIGGGDPGLELVHKTNWGQIVKASSDPTQKMGEGISLKPNGTQLFIVDQGSNFGVGDHVFQFDLTTADDASTMVFQSSHNYGTETIRAKGLWMGLSCDKVYIIRKVPCTVRQYSLTPPGPTSVDVGLANTDTYESGGVMRKTVNKITDLGCVEGLEVKVVGDGSEEPDATVSNFSVTIDDTRRVARAQIGLPYTCDIETLDIEVETPPATIQGKRKKLTELMVRFYKSRMPTIGPSSSRLIQMRPRGLASEKFDEASSLITGDVFVNVKPEWNSHGRVFIRMCDPFPITILGLFPEFSSSKETDDG